MLRGTPLIEDGSASDASDSSLHETPTQAVPPALPDHVSEANKSSTVSPMESPVLGSRVRDSGSSSCVSPIDDAEKSPRHRRQDSQTSGIVADSSPVDASPSPPRPAQSVPKTVQFAPSHDQQPTRWDDFSGEPTTNINGKASQVNPRNTTFHRPPGSHASNFLHWGREQLQPKKQLAKARNRISSLSRYDNPPPKETRGRPSSRVLSVGEPSHNQSDAAPQLNHLGFVPTVVTTITAGNSKPLSEKPTAEHDNGSKRRDASTSRFDAAIANMMQAVPSSSRFDSTTAAANATNAKDGPTDSPNDSPRGSINLGKDSTDDTPSIMGRRRPVPIAMPISKKPVRKPTPLEAAQAPKQPDNAQEPASETQLPSAEPEPPKSPQSRIASFEARRDELRKRRFNLETVIHELTRVIQPGSLAYDLAAKAEVKKSVQSIENEIAEIKREEHELGMKVTRAWRRLDEKENNGDGSNLWVKRVTS